MHDLPSERGQKVSEGIEVALLMAILVVAGGCGFEGKDTPLSTVAVSEGGGDFDPWCFRFVAEGFVNVTLFGLMVNVGMINGNQQFLNAQAELHISVVPMETPSGYAIDVFPVQLHPPVGSTVRLLVPVKLLDSAPASFNVAKFGMAFKLGNGVRVHPLCDDKLQHEESKVAISLETPVLP